MASAAPLLQTPGALVHSAPRGESHFRDLPADLDLELIVPALNEELRIEATLRALSAQLSSMPMRAGIRVIDNGSSDRTSEIVDHVARQGVPIAVSGCARRGKGAAVARGMTTSTARWVGFCDADLATDPAAIEDAVRLLADGWQVVIGSRRCPSARVAGRQPLLRRAGSKAFRHASRRYTGGISDTQCGFKFFDGGAARTLFATTVLTGFAFDLEVVAKARAMNLTVTELGVVWNDRAGSTFSPMRHGVEVARELWRFRRVLAPSPQPSP